MERERERKRGGRERKKDRQRFFIVEWSKFKSLFFIFEWGGGVEREKVGGWRGFEFDLILNFVT